MLICIFSLYRLHLFAHKMWIMKESTKFSWRNSIRVCKKQNKHKNSPSSKKWLIDAKGNTDGGNGVSKEELEKIWMETRKSAAIQLCQELQWEILIMEDISILYSPLRALLRQPQGKQETQASAFLSPASLHCWLTRQPWVSHSLPDASTWPCQGAANKEAKQTHLWQLWQTSFIMLYSSFPHTTSKQCGQGRSFRPGQAIFGAGSHCPGVADM